MKKSTLLLLFFIALKFILQYNLIAPDYDLHRDEYLHLDQGQHLAWGYNSVPPFTAWIAYIIALLGNGLFWIKFFPALFGALTLYLVVKTIETIGGSLFAQALGATALLFSAILRLNLLYQPNSADLFFWTLVYFTLIKYFHSQNTKWLYYTAIAFAFGMLNKYNILFLALGLFAALLVTAQRKILVNKSLYFAAIVSFVLFLPNLIWQYQNNFPVVAHMNELAVTQLDKVNRMDFVKEQILFFIGSIFILIAGLVSLVFLKRFKTYRFVFWSYVFTLTLFIILRAKGYYAMGLYPVLIAFGAVYLESILSHGWKRYLRPVAIALPIVLFIPIFLVAFPIDSPEAIAKQAERYKSLGLLRWEDGKDHALPQDFADMICWKEMAEKVDSAYALIPDKSHTLILCDNYGQAGAVNYYSRFPELRAVSFNADYIEWFPLDKKIKNVIAIKEADDDDPTRKRELPIFKTVYLSGTIENKLAREYGTKIFVYLGAKTDINKRISDEIAESRW